MRSCCAVFVGLLPVLTGTLTALRAAGCADPLWPHQHLPPLQPPHAELPVLQAAGRASAAPVLQLAAMICRGQPALDTLTGHVLLCCSCLVPTGNRVLAQQSHGISRGVLPIIEHPRQQHVRVPFQALTALDRVVCLSFPFVLVS